MKNKKLIYGGIVVVGLFVLYSLFKGKKASILLVSGGDSTPFDPNEDFSKYISATFNPIEEAKKDSVFLSKVKLLQTKLNRVLKSKYPNEPILKVDGLLGNNTLRAIVRIFGDRTLPIQNKQQIDYLNNQI